MREIKFEFLFKGMPFSADNKGFNWHKKVYSLDQLISSSLDDLCGGESLLGELVAKRQYTGLKDKNGVEIYDGDALRMNHDDGESNYAGIVCWVAEGDWLGWGLLVGRYHDELKVVNQSSIEVIGNIHQNPELLGDS